MHSVTSCHVMTAIFACYKIEIRNLGIGPRYPLTEIEIFSYLRACLRYIATARRARFFTVSGRL